MRKIDKRKNIMKANILAENLYLSSKSYVNENLTFDTLPDCVKNNFEKNITISVAFVKKDGTVRHIAFRRNLLSYKKSEKQKTDKQLNYLSANNLMNVYDTNSFIKNKKQNIEAGMEPEQAAEEAAKKSFRNIRLDNVLGFLCSGQFYDMREINQIADRFGEEIASQLTKAMVNNMKSDEMLINEELNEPKPVGEEGKRTNIALVKQKIEELTNERNALNLRLKALYEELKKWEDEIDPNQLQMFPEY